MTCENDSDRELLYALARTPEEAERLNEQSVLWREATSRVLDKLQLTPGMSCLDLGCGAGAGPPDGIEVSCFIKPVSVLRAFLLLSYRSLLPAALELGVTTEEKAEKLMAFLEDDGDHNASYWLSALYCGVWKRKP